MQYPRAVTERSRALMVVIINVRELMSSARTRNDVMNVLINTGVHVNCMWIACEFQFIKLIQFNSNCCITDTWHLMTCSSHRRASWKFVLRDFTNQFTQCYKSVHPVCRNYM